MSIFEYEEIPELMEKLSELPQPYYPNEWVTGAVTGPAGSGKSVATNHLLNRAIDRGMNVVILDTNESVHRPLIDKYDGEIIPLDELREFDPKEHGEHDAPNFESIVDELSVRGKAVTIIEVEQKFRDEFDSDYSLNHYKRRSRDVFKAIAKTMRLNGNEVLGVVEEIEYTLPKDVTPNFEITVEPDCIIRAGIPYILVSQNTEYFEGGNNLNLKWVFSPKGVHLLSPGLQSDQMFDRTEEIPLPETIRTKVQK